MVVVPLTLPIAVLGGVDGAVVVVDGECWTGPRAVVGDPGAVGPDVAEVVVALVALVAGAAVVVFTGVAGSRPVSALVAMSTLPMNRRGLATSRGSCWGPRLEQTTAIRRRGDRFPTGSR